ncbi:MAG: B12-binding domain-containing radical SAM protein [Desulfuromonadaceae bacterium]
MRILLLAMPDTVDFIENGARIPNLALVSLAGNLPGHDVRVLDLAVYKPRIRQPLEKILGEFRPQLVGLSSMTFQFSTLLKVARLVRGFDPGIKIVAGGYHPSLMARELGPEELAPLDFIVRGEGEATLPELVTALEKPQPELDRIKGLSYRQGDRWQHNPDRPLLDLDQILLPHREARLADDFFFLDMSMDVAETSRGCPYNCKFCSINRMYGSTYRRYPIPRIIEDLQAIRRRGTKSVFFADDNITYDIEHFRQVCQAIVQHGLNDMCYMTQVTAVGIAKNPDLVAEMDRANFRIIFVGFESMEPAALKEMKKPTSPAINRQAAALLREHKMAIIAGAIVGYPDDDRESVTRQMRQIWGLKPDSVYAQILTPYPQTLLRQELLEAGLIVNLNDFRTYNGFESNIRTKYLGCKELERLKGDLAFWGAFNLDFWVRNRLLRNHSRYFIKSIAKNIGLYFYYLLISGKHPGQLDI